MLQTPHRYYVALSITGIVRFVEFFPQPCSGLDLFQQLHLCPVVPQSGPEIPDALVKALTAF